MQIKSRRPIRFRRRLPNRGLLKLVGAGIASEFKLQRTPQGTRTLILAGCLAAAFVTTHLPASTETAPPIDDKLLHFLGFMLLGGLVSWRNKRGLHGLAWSSIPPAYIALVVYAAIDELTQPPFGRDCEFYDWLADCGGGAAGLILGALVAGRAR